MFIICGFKRVLQVGFYGCQDNPSAVSKVLSNVPLSFMNMISEKNIICVQCRSTAGFFGELFVNGEFFCSLFQLCHWGWLELFSTSLLVAFTLRGVSIKSNQQFLRQGDKDKITVSGLSDEVLDCKCELFSFPERFPRTSNVKPWLPCARFPGQRWDLDSALFSKLQTSSNNLFWCLLRSGGPKQQEVPLTDFKTRVSSMKPWG